MRRRQSPLVERADARRSEPKADAHATLADACGDGGAGGNSGALCPTVAPCSCRALW